MPAVLVALCLLGLVSVLAHRAVLRLSEATRRLVDAGPERAVHSTAALDAAATTLRAALDERRA